MNKLKLGEMSGPVRSPFGWHLIVVEERRTQDVTEDRRREQARTAIRQRKSDEQFQEFVRQSARQGLRRIQDRRPLGRELLRGRSASSSGPRNPRVRSRYVPVSRPLAPRISASSRRFAGATRRSVSGRAGSRRAPARPARARRTRVRSASVDRPARRGRQSRFRACGGGERRPTAHRRASRRPGRAAARQAGAVESSTTRRHARARSSMSPPGDSTIARRDRACHGPARQRARACRRSAVQPSPSACAACRRSTAARPAAVRAREQEVARRVLERRVAPRGEGRVAGLAGVDAVCCRSTPSARRSARRNSTGRAGRGTRPRTSAGPAGCAGRRCCTRRPPSAGRSRRAWRTASAPLSMRTSFGAASPYRITPRWPCAGFAPAIDMPPRIVVASPGLSTVDARRASRRRRGAIRPCDDQMRSRGMPASTSHCASSS